MLDKIQSTGTRLVQLREKLAAREGKAEYKKNCEAIKAEIARLETVTVKPTVASKTKRVKSAQPSLSKMGTGS